MLIHSVGSPESGGERRAFLRLSGEEAGPLLRFLKRIRAACRTQDGDFGGLFGLNAKVTSSSFTATTPEFKKRLHMPLNCTLVPREGTGVVHHFGFSAE